MGYPVTSIGIDGEDAAIRTVAVTTGKEIGRTESIAPDTGGICCGVVAGNLGYRTGNDAVTNGSPDYGMIVSHRRQPVEQAEQ